MSAIEQIRALYGYNEWANGHVLEAASRLDDAGLRQELGASFGSVHGNLTHMLFAQKLWLSRWTGERSLSPSGETDLAALGHDLAASSEALRAYVAALSEEELGSELAYTDTQGSRQRATLWHTLLQVANHGTHHRAETALLLTALGHPPRQLDFMFFQLENAGGPPRLT